MKLRSKVFSGSIDLDHSADVAAQLDLNPLPHFIIEVMLHQPVWLQILLIVVVLIYKFNDLLLV